MRTHLTPPLFLALVFLSGLAWADTLTGQVVKVTDGDTITVLEVRQHKIRLAGIDAPESGQAYGNVSKKHLASLIAGKTVTVDWNKRDRYGRIVGKVILDGKDICLEQIKAGMAWHYMKYQGEQSPEDRRRYIHAEDAARINRLGLWRDKNPIPPWEWRDRLRNGS